LAGLIVTLLASGVADADSSLRGMAVGAAGFVVYSPAAVPLCPPRHVARIRPCPSRRGSRRDGRLLPGADMNREPSQRRRQPADAIRVSPADLKQPKTTDWLIRFAFDAGVSRIAAIAAKRILRGELRSGRTAEIDTEGDLVITIVDDDPDGADGGDRTVLVPL
jgi:hypothetical protein